MFEGHETSEESLEYFTPAEVANRFGVKLETVLYWIKVRKLRGINVSCNPRVRGPRFRIKSSDLEEYLRIKASGGFRRPAKEKSKPVDPNFIDYVELMDARRSRKQSKKP